MKKSKINNTHKKNKSNTLPTVIVVEDDEGLNRLIQMTLKKEGFPTKGATTGSEVLKIAVENPNSVLLLDFLLPKMTAEDIILALNKKKLRVPFIIMTGHGNEKVAIKLMKLGAKDYIVKDTGLIDMLPHIVKRVTKELDHEKKLADTEEALRKSEEKYRSIFETAANLITSVNKEGTIVDCNCRANQFLGYKPHEIIGQSITKIIHPDYHAKARDNLKKLFAKGSLYNHEYKMIRKDGTIIDVNINSSALRNDNGEFYRTICIINDITERKNIRKELEWELKINKALAELSNTLVVSLSSIEDIANIVLDYARLVTNSKHGYVSTIDPVTGDNIKYTNARMMENQCLTTGKDKKNVFSKREDGYYPGLWGHALNTCKAFYTNSPDTHKSSGGIPEGNIPINNFLSVPVIFGKELIGQIALADSDGDYTERDLKVIQRIADLYAIAINRKQMEEKLRKSEASLVEAQCIAKMGNYVWDSKKDELSWSQGIYPIFKVKSNVFKPNFQEFIDFIHPDDRRRVTEVFKKAIINKTKYSVEYRVMLLDGTERILLDNGEICCDEFNRPVRIFGVVQDITERKNLEKAILEIEDRERQRIGYELHDGLGQLLTGISFKNRGLECKLERLSFKEAKDAAEISRLIYEAKEQVGCLSKGLSPVEMDEEGLTAALGTLAFDTNKMFGIPCVLKCDKPVSVHNKTAITQLYRIAQEAITNAVKHGKPKQIEIFLSKKYGKISMTIKDDGKGIPKISKQVEGMGLRIMQYRASVINGSFAVQRDINGGTIVTCTFSDKNIKKDLFETSELTKNLNPSTPAL